MLFIVLPQRAQIAAGVGLQPDEGIGPEHVPELVRLIMVEITPFIMSQNNAQMELQRIALQHLLQKATLKDPLDE